jgi:hypothetical protein
MFYKIGEHTAQVNIGRPTVEDQVGPKYVDFILEDGSVHGIEVATFQILRRAVNREVGSIDHKIYLIKAVRGLTKLGLREAKNVVEYFLANFQPEVGIK